MSNKRYTHSTVNSLTAHRVYFSKKFQNFIEGDYIQTNNFDDIITKTTKIESNGLEVESIWVAKYGYIPIEFVSKIVEINVIKKTIITEEVKELNNIYINN
jgi:hypothetical protein